MAKFIHWEGQQMVNLELVLAIQPVDSAYHYEIVFYSSLGPGATIRWGWPRDIAGGQERDLIHNRLLERFTTEWI